MTQQLMTEKDPRGVLTLTLNRPAVHNAFDDGLIAELVAALLEADRDDNLRVVVLTGAGKSFSSGADLNWMRAMAGYSEGENLEDALGLAELMAVLNGMRIPTVAKVNGHAFGGGVGLVACCDIAVAASHARFALSEVRLGLVPAVIAPYVVAAMGEREARRWCLSAETMDAKTARRCGLVHETAEAGDLDDVVAGLVDALLAGGPRAQRACKALIANISHGGVTAGQVLRQRTAELIAQIRVSDEGQEGLAAFLEKRRAEWQDAD